MSGRTSTYERAQPMLARPIATESPRLDGELNYVLPQARTLPASTFAVSTCGVFIPRTPSGRVLSRLRRVQFPPSCQISLGRELGGDTAQDCAESLGFATSIIGSRHTQQYEVSDGQEVGAGFQGCGNAD